MKRANTKKLIIEKATDLFYRYGFVKASIRDIVRSVGVTNSTVYSHFKNKDEILYSIIENIGAIVLERLHAVIEEHDDPVECLREMIFAHICLMDENRKELKIYIEEQYQLSPPLRKMARKQHRQIYDIYYNKIREIEDNGLLREIDTTVMTFSVSAMMNWVYRWFREDGKLSIEEVAEDIIKVLFSGIFKEGAVSDKISMGKRRGG